MFWVFIGFFGLRDRESRWREQPKAEATNPRLATVTVELLMVRTVRVVVNQNNGYNGRC